VVVFVAALYLMWWSAGQVPWLQFEMPLQWLAVGACVAGSGYFGIAGVVEFRRAQTTVNPHTPDKASTVVQSGVFRYTRNPMYLGLALLLIGAFFYWQNGVTLLVIIGFFAYLNRFQITPEERVLTQKYGQDYIRYLSRVRRWI